MIYSVVLGPLQAFRNHGIFVKSNVPFVSLLIKRREKSQKEFDLSV